MQMISYLSVRLGSWFLPGVLGTDGVFCEGGGGAELRVLDRARLHAERRDALGCKWEREKA